MNELSPMMMMTTTTEMPDHHIMMVNQSITSMMQVNDGRHFVITVRHQLVCSCAYIYDEFLLFLAMGLDISR